MTDTKILQSESVNDRRARWELLLLGRALIVFLGAVTVFPLSLIVSLVRGKTGLQAFLMFLFAAAGLSVFYAASRGIIVGFVTSFVPFST